MNQWLLAVNQWASKVVCAFLQSKALAQKKHRKVYSQDTFLLLEGVPLFCSFCEIASPLHIQHLWSNTHAKTLVFGAFVESCDWFKLLHCPFSCRLHCSVSKQFKATANFHKKRESLWITFPRSQGMIQARHIERGVTVLAIKGDEHVLFCGEWQCHLLMPR